MDQLSFDFSGQYYALCLLLLIFKARDYDNYLTLDCKLEELADLLVMNPSLIYFKELEKCSSLQKLRSFSSLFSRHGKFLTSEDTTCLMLNLLLNNDNVEVFDTTNEKFELGKAVLISPILFMQEESEYHSDDNAGIEPDQIIDKFKDPILIRAGNSDDDSMDGRFNDSESIEMVRDDSERFHSPISDSMFDNVSAIDWNLDLNSGKVIEEKGREPIIRLDEGGVQLISDTMLDESSSDENDSDIYNPKIETRCFKSYMNENGFIQEDLFVEPSLKEIEEDRQIKEDKEMENIVQTIECEIIAGGGTTSLWYELYFGDADQVEEDEDEVPEGVQGFLSEDEGDSFQDDDDDGEEEEEEVEQVPPIRVEDPRLKKSRFFN